MNLLLTFLLTMLPFPEVHVAHHSTLLFAGDMMQHTAQLESAHKDGIYNYDGCFNGVSSVIRQADIAICNLEVTLGGKPYTGYPAFSAPDEFASAIVKAGFDIMLTANNHCLDRGRKGLIRTLNVLDSLGVAHTGTFRNRAERDTLYPLVVENNGIRLAFLNYTYGTNGIDIPDNCIVNLIDTTQIAQDLAKARQQKADCIIVCMHWGDEYKTIQNKTQEELAAWLISNGADHVIGSHPHVIQPTVLLPDSQGGLPRHVVAYSMGNFISNMSARGTDTGIMVKLKLARFISTTWLESYRTYNVRTLRPAVSGKTYFQVIQAD